MDIQYLLEEPYPDIIRVCVKKKTNLSDDHLCLRDYMIRYSFSTWNRTRNIHGITSVSRFIRFRQECTKSSMPLLEW